MANSDLQLYVRKHRTGEWIMMSELVTLGAETIERLVRIESEQAINDGITEGQDANAIVKRVLTALFSDRSKLVAAARAIPGLKYAPHLILTAAAEVLSRSVDKFLPGDQRPMLRMVRLVLKASAPAIIGIGEAASDVIDDQINKAVDRTISPNRASATDRNKSVDMIAVIEHPLFGAAHPFFPVARDDAGVIRKTEWKPNRVGRDLPAVHRGLRTAQSAQGRKREEDSADFISETLYRGRLGPDGSVLRCAGGSGQARGDQAALHACKGRGVVGKHMGRDPRLHALFGTIPADGTAGLARP